MKIFALACLGEGKVLIWSGQLVSDYHWIHFSNTSDVSIISSINSRTIAVAYPGFLRGGAPTPDMERKPIIWPGFYRKLHKKWKELDRGGGEHLLGSANDIDSSSVAVLYWSIAGYFYWQSDDPESHLECFTYTTSIWSWITSFPTFLTF